MGRVDGSPPRRRRPRRVVDPSGLVHEYGDPSPPPPRAPEPAYDPDYVSPAFGARWRWKWALLVALLTSWTAFWLALLVGAFAAVVGAILGGTGVLAGSTQLPDWLAQITANAGPLGALAGAVAGFLAGFLAGFGVVYGFDLANGSARVLESLAIGLVASVLLSGLYARLEPFVDRVALGARRLSTDEHAELDGPYAAAAGALGVQNPPPLLMRDIVGVEASTGQRSILVSRGLLSLDEDQRTALLAHELAHWQSADPFALRAVWACCWPTVLIYTLGSWLSRMLGTLGRLGWFFLWPAAVIMRLIVAPVVGITSRQREYEADAAVRRAGYGGALADVLEVRRDFEPGHAGWDKIVAGTHPPEELRVDALRYPETADTRPEIPASVPGLAALLVLAVVVGLWVVSLTTPAGSGIRSAEPTAVPPTLTPVPASVAILGTWVEVSYNGQPTPSGLSTFTYRPHGRFSWLYGSNVPRRDGTYRLVDGSHIAFHLGRRSWTAHFSISGADLETDTPGQRSVWRYLHG